VNHVRSRRRGAATIAAIEARVRPTICQTYSTGRAPTVEGRISEDDFDVLLTLARANTPTEGR
jgi:hypothetical protein